LISILRLDILYLRIVYGDLLDDQKRFIEGLKQVNDIMIWILDKDYNIFRVLNTDWNYEEHKDILEPLLQGGLG
jgi:ABC-type phosphate/phosphonate transport system permease subunit